MRLDVVAGQRNVGRSRRGRPAPATASAAKTKAPRCAAINGERAGRCLTCTVTVTVLTGARCLNGFGAHVLLGERVDVLVGALVGQLGGAADADPAIGVVAVDHEHGDVGIAFEVVRLDPPPSGVEAQVLAVGVDPHRGDLRRAVGHHGGDETEVRLVDQRKVVGGQHVVTHPPF